MEGDRLDSGILTGGPEDLDRLHRLLSERPYRAAFGQWVRAQRVGRGWQRAELGHLIGLATSTVGNVEGGLTRLSRHALRRMLQALVGADPHWVFVHHGSPAATEWWEFRATGEPARATPAPDPSGDLARLDRLTRQWAALPRHIQVALVDLVEAAVTGGRLPSPGAGAGGSARDGAWKTGLPEGWPHEARP